MNSFMPPPVRDRRERRDMRDSNQECGMSGKCGTGEKCAKRNTRCSSLLAPVPPLSLFALFSVISPPTLQRFNQGADHGTELLDTLSEFYGLLSVEVSDFFRNDHLGHYLTR